MCWLRVLSLLFLCTTVAGLEINPINIGILHSAHSSWIEVVQEYAAINGTEFIHSTIVNDTRWCSLADLDAGLEMIKKLDVVAIVGHYNKVIAAVTDHFRIPYFVTSLVPMTQAETPYHIKMLPPLSIYHQAIRDLFTHYKWNTVGVIYDNEPASYLAAKLMAHTIGKKDLYDIRAYNLQQNASADVVRWALKDLRDKIVTNFLVICTSQVTDVVLTQALYLSLLSRPNSWLVVNLGYGDVELGKFVDSKANLTLLRLMVDPYSPCCALNDSEISLTKALYYDVLHVFKETVNSSDDKVSRSDIRKKIKQIDISGCTGHLTFNRNGRRNETFLQMLALEGLVSGASGTWRSGKSELKDRIQTSKTYSRILDDKGDVFGDQPLRVTLKIEEPFVQWRNKSEEEVFYGNERFEGFCVDILEEIAKLLKFKYNLSLVPDGKFGSKKPWGWTGMVNELINDRADIALAPFSITPSRSEVVDFTKPFMTKGTSVVVKKPERTVWPFQFLSPLSHVVWITIFVSFVLIGFFLFGFSRINSDRKKDYKANMWESYWYVWGTLLRADLSGSPQAASGRILACTWWFFSLIVISIYTANLAAFLTINNAQLHIDSAADLGKQSEYNYGTVDGSQIEYFFKHTKLDDYAKMYAHMFSPGSKVRRVENGFDRVMKEKYAFIWDSPTVRHATANNCMLMEIGTPFDLKGYGIATRKNSPYTEKLSLALLNLNDDGVLYMLEGKWWRRPNCPDHRSNAESKAIGIDVASGMFIIVACGVVLSILVCIVQSLIRWHLRKKKKSSADMTGSNLQSNHNHIPSVLFEDSSTLEDTNTNRARTLSLGDSCANSKWE